MKKLVVLSGAGISAESGISTFRDNGGLWDNYRIEDVATPEAWHKNQEFVLDFYNQRRKQASSVKPNPAHYALAELEKHFEITIITQNVDNLHEIAGSTNVIHLHGELFKSRSTKNPDLVYEMKSWELKKGDLCELGSQLRPHIVWFGEEVPMMETAIDITEQADLFLVIGTSLAVYPAAGLVHYVGSSRPIYIIDPAKPDIGLKKNMTFIQEKATTGMEILTKKLIDEQQI
ncbi:SIR2 family NAD-dependent protein deacylase [Dyadobacter sediminis]|uniref:NAD-dependent protein deacylase n=1 Tax=Dyadobacter sediminis TaxID=1493691 RepID=A0A5R9KKM1_9BACT|nr:NAD-dependent deacylase [Dyadobacter sediminis]TLU96771.1 NAD-dependent deacylase [Dyadobacter sediminis]GGB85024.1 NAD-dependent protein deacylase [Dyadobacter sediminis]